MINLGQDVVDQVGLHIQVLYQRQRMIGGAVGGMSTHDVDRAIALQFALEGVAVQALAHVAVHNGDDVGTALEDLLTLVDQDKRPDWQAQIDQLRKAHPLFYNHNGNLRHPVSLIDRIGSLINGKAIIATDVGQHQMWVAQIYPFSSPRTLLTSGGLGTMGFGLPAAIGAALANPEWKIVCISGDGSFLMNIQELATLAEHNLNVSIIIMNNQHLGLVRQQQELFYHNRLFASRFDCAPDFAAIAKGFGIASYNLDGKSYPLKALEHALKQPGPSVVNIPINGHLNVYPMVPPGAPNREMIGGEYNEQ